jgi:uncharacterized protein
MTEPPRPPGDGGDQPSGEETSPGYPPPPPGYPPPGGYPPPPSGYYHQGPPPPGYANNDEKTWALIAHFGGAAGAFLGGWLGFLGPLIAMVAKGNQSPTVRAHAVEALNFQLTWIGASVALTIVMCCATIVTLGIGAIGFITLGAPWLVATIVGVLAGVKANEGQFYRYPMSIRVIK